MTSKNITHKDTPYQSAGDFAWGVTCRAATPRKEVWIFAARVHNVPAIYSDKIANVTQLDYFNVSVGSGSENVNERRRKVKKDNLLQMYLGTNSINIQDT